MKWDNVSKHLPGRSAMSCRLRFQNYLERRAVWDDEKKDELARLYERYVITVCTSHDTANKPQGSERICGGRSPKRWLYHGGPLRECTGTLVKSRWPVAPMCLSSALLARTRKPIRNLNQMLHKHSTTTLLPAQDQLLLMLVSRAAAASPPQLRRIATISFLTPSFSRLPPTLCRRCNRDLSHLEA